jgi:signal peptidase I
MDIKKFLKKFWFIVWKDNSFKGWIITIVFLFILIKFIFFPLLSLATGTSLPLAIVESCSMYHQGNLLSNFDNWWEIHKDNYKEFSIEQVDFQNYIFKKGFNKGDILFIVKANPDTLKKGDVIIFNAGYNYPIIHRIINIEGKDGEKIFTTMGDNVGHVQIFEETILEKQLVGKAAFKLAPYLGWTKLILFEFSQPQEKRGFCNAN